MTTAVRNHINLPARRMGKTIANQRHWLQLELAKRFGFPMPRLERWVKGGWCPQCGHRSLFYWAAWPDRVRCQRQHRCAFELSTRALFPEVFAERPWPWERLPIAAAE